MLNRGAILATSPQSSALARTSSEPFGVGFTSGFGSGLGSGFGSGFGAGFGATSGTRGPPNPGSRANNDSPSSLKRNATEFENCLVVGKTRNSTFHDPTFSGVTLMSSPAHFVSSETLRLR
jgi:hypothetical protein